MGRVGAYPIHGDTSSAQESTPYVQALTCQAINGTSISTLPAAAMFFTEAACPNGYKTMATFSGRFIVGLQPGV